MYLWVLALFVVCTVAQSRGCSVEMDTVSGSREENVSLPCLHLEPTEPESSYRVKWMKHGAGGGQATVLLTRPITSQFQDSQRVKWEADKRGQMSLFLANVQTSDVGVYTCEVWKGWDCIVHKNISLRVKDCKTHVVRAAPGMAVNQSCPVGAELGQQTPQNVSWAFLKGRNAVFLSSDTLFYIQSVAVADFGWYRCNYTLGQTQHCIDIHLVQAAALPASSTSAEQVSTTRVSVWETKERKEVSASLASAGVKVVAVAALTGLCIYCRSKTCGIGQRTERTGARLQSTHSYEMVRVEFPEEPTNQRVCSLYGPCQHESMQTLL